LILAQISCVRPCRSKRAKKRGTSSVAVFHKTSWSVSKSTWINRFRKAMIAGHGTDEAAALVSRLTLDAASPMIFDDPNQRKPQHQICVEISAPSSVDETQARLTGLDPRLGEILRA
jgi:hypothetical protein